jgi:hypothetical protein
MAKLILRLIIFLTLLKKFSTSNLTNPPSKEKENKIKRKPLSRKRYAPVYVSGSSGTSTVQTVLIIIGSICFFLGFIFGLIHYCKKKEYEEISLDKIETRDVIEKTPYDKNILLCPENHKIFLMVKHLNEFKKVEMFKGENFVICDYCQKYRKTKIKFFRCERNCKFHICYFCFIGYEKIRIPNPNMNLNKENKMFNNKDIQNQPKNGIKILNNFEKGKNNFQINEKKMLNIKDSIYIDKYPRNNFPRQNA